MTIREDAKKIMNASLVSALPDNAVHKALALLPEVKGKLYLVAIGKAAWQMSKAAVDFLGDQISDGVCITKYGHVLGEIPHIRSYEAGHPVLDENSIKATKEAELLVDDLLPEDMVLFLVSGGGSALFENPLVPLEELQNITKQLLDCGANITEINTLRKRLSSVKGGKFAKTCEPAQVYAIVLSDIIGDPLDMIASGPAYPDSSSAEDALEIVRKYNLKLTDNALRLLSEETPKACPNVETKVTGSVRQLCASAIAQSKELGYEPVFLTSSLDCIAREAGTFLADIAKDYSKNDQSMAFILGGETVVNITGNGKGGRCQELALSAARGIDGLEDVCIFAMGSDGTDGPTDAAGGIVDGNTAKVLKDKNINIDDYLKNNDAYHALKECDGLIMTGATGTNVNDVIVLLIKR